MIFLILISILIGLLSYFYYVAEKRRNYWKDRNIPHIESPLWGHFFATTFLQEHVTTTLTKLYNHERAKNQKFVGINIFHKPAILVRDPELVKRILVKDFNYFTNRHTATDLRSDPLAGNNLFLSNNPLWKILRSKLSPIFTSGKMKQMFYMVDKIGNDLNEVISVRVKNGSSEMPIRVLFQMFTIDAISLVAFATESNCLKDPANSDFLKNAKMAFAFTFMDKLSGTCCFYLQELMKLPGMHVFNPVFGKFLSELLYEVTEKRLKDGGIRNDLVDALIKIKSDAVNQNDSVITDELLAAQALLFFFAGFETSSSTIHLLFYLLAQNPEVQKKVREEIQQAFEKHGKLTYEFICNDMPYTTNVIKETLRLYPILPFLDRECVLPNADTKGYSLEPYSSFEIPPGMPIYIPAHAIQHDPEYFPDPDKFNPDRFDENSSSYNEYSYMPFGLGPRACIGERFALLQMRIGIVNVLKSFTVEVTNDTPKNFQFEPTNVLLIPDKELILRFVESPLKF
uniref:CSON013221 protein n=1 Tax=Culicoides sonorensis TaxID=179676 RepID=A0A336K519_CULSO